MPVQTRVLADHPIDRERSFEAPPRVRAEGRATARVLRQRHIAAASFSGARAGTSVPPAPLRSTSGVPPTAVATTGRPAAIASRIVIETPSLMELLA
jgi:hypothetical protein